jgi:hypothetical protein
VIRDPRAASLSNSRTVTRYSSSLFIISFEPITKIKFIEIAKTSFVLASEAKQSRY